ncbi:YggT family protein [Schaalia odontolytica]
MIILGWVGWALSVVINLYMMVLFARVILDWIQFFARGWRPSGILLVVANVLYALTDPPIRWIGRFIPPLCVGGGMAIDVGFMVLFLVLIVGQRLANVLYFMSV